MNTTANSTASLEELTTILVDEFGFDARRMNITETYLDLGSDTVPALEIWDISYATVARFHTLITRALGRFPHRMQRSTALVEPLLQILAGIPVDEPKGYQQGSFTITGMDEILAVLDACYTGTLWED